MEHSEIIAKWRECGEAITLEAGLRVVAGSSGRFLVIGESVRKSGYLNTRVNSSRENSESRATGGRSTAIREVPWQTPIIS